MPTIVYALSSQGRGHLSRAIAVGEELERRGHQVMYACGGEAFEGLAAADRIVFRIPGLVQVLRRNRLDLLETIRANVPTVLRARRIDARIRLVLTSFQPDLVVTDFEAFVPRAAQRLGLPVLSLCNQELLLEPALPVPARFRQSARLLRLFVRALVPLRPVHRIVPSLCPVATGRAVPTTVVEPILRRQVREAAVTTGAHLVAYLNTADDVDAIVASLAEAGVPVHLYGVSAAETSIRSPQLTFCAGSDEAFLADLAACRGVVTTAGFTLLSECVALGKPVLALPNGGIFEQTLNALCLERMGAGRAVYAGAPTAADLQALLAAPCAPEASGDGAFGDGSSQDGLSVNGQVGARRAMNGHRQAADLIEQHLPAWPDA